MRHALTALAALFAGEHALAATFEPNTAVWAAETLRHVREDPFNPANLVSRAARESDALEVRPDWRVIGERWKLTARPRVLLTRDTVHTGGGTDSRTLALFRWSEAFGSLTLSDSFSLDYGLQNFQWGPAEAASPSNRLFRDTVQAKDALYLVHGQHLVRLTYAPTAAWSEVLVVEPTDNGDGEPEPFEPHTAKAALKSEVAWNGGADFAGLVGGWRNRANGYWVGEYVNLEPLEGLYAYVDASHEKGSLAYYPVRAGTYTIFAQNRRNETNWEHFVVGGLRYAFENGNDWRVEWIYQSAGYTQAELDRAVAALSSRDAVQFGLLARQGTAARVSGLDFPSRNYLFTSARFPNAWGRRDWNLYVRALISAQDRSASAFGSTESRLGERGTLIGGIAATFGRGIDELKGVVDFAGTLAYRHAW